jgi:hypothetical protein
MRLLTTLAPPLLSLSPLRKLRASAGLVALLGAALFGAGCGSRQLPVFPVHGLVVYEGRPAAEALVIFHPVKNEGAFANVRPIGRVGADGSFTLTTYSADDGAPAGEYDVTIDWREHTAPVEGAPPGRSLLPARYSSPQQTQLHVQITEGSNDLQPFKLTR